MSITLLDDSPLLKMVGRRMELEGETLGPGGLVLGHNVPGQKGVVGGLEEVPTVGVRALGFDLSGGTLDFLIARWWDLSGGWRDWTALGVPLLRLWTGDQGPMGTGGCASRPMEGSLGDLFVNRELEGLLSLKGFSGLVTLGMCSEDGKPTNLWFDDPFYFLLNLLEARTGTVSDFLLGKSKDLHSSWVVGLSVSRWPFPLGGEAPRMTIPGLGESVERHFWASGLERYKGSSYSSHNFLGVATSWGDSLRTANSFALRTCRNLRVPHLQYRLDCPRQVEPTLGRVRDRFLVDS